MLCIPLADLDKLAEQILIASRRLTDGDGLKVYGGGYKPDEGRNIALIALHILRNEPVHCADTVDITFGDLRGDR